MTIDNPNTRHIYLGAATGYIETLRGQLEAMAGYLEAREPGHFAIGLARDTLEYDWQAMAQRKAKEFGYE